MNADLRRILSAEDARKQLYSRCEEALAMGGLAEEAGREVEEIRARMGRANPVGDGWSRVLEQVTSDTSRLDRIIGTAAHPAVRLSPTILSTSSGKGR
jgi:hypothetical protein